MSPQLRTIQYSMVWILDVAYISVFKGFPFSPLTVRFSPAAFVFKFSPQMPDKNTVNISKKGGKFTILTSRAHNPQR